MLGAQHNTTHCALAFALGFRGFSAEALFRIGLRPRHPLQLQSALLRVPCCAAVLSHGLACAPLFRAFQLNTWHPAKVLGPRMPTCPGLQLKLREIMHKLLSDSGTSKAHGATPKTSRGSPKEASSQQEAQLISSASRSSAAMRLGVDAVAEPRLFAFSIGGSASAERVQGSQAIRVKRAQECPSMSRLGSPPGKGSSSKVSTSNRRPPDLRRSSQFLLQGFGPGVRPG